MLDDNTYGIWYLDSLDHVDRYVGKTIEFIGMVMKPEEFPERLLCARTYGNDLLCRGYDLPRLCVRLR